MKLICENCTHFRQHDISLVIAIWRFVTATASIRAAKKETVTHWPVSTSSYDKISRGKPRKKASILG